MPHTLAIFVSETLGEVINSVATEMASEARWGALRYGIQVNLRRNFLGKMGSIFVKLPPKKDGSVYL